MALVIGLGISTWMYFKEREARHEQTRMKGQTDRARANESRLLLQAEVRERISRAAALLAEGKSDEAGALLARIILLAHRSRTCSMEISK